MKHILGILFLILFSSAVFSFDKTDSIVIRKTTVTYFLKDGKKMRPKYLLRAMKHDENAYRVMERARTNYDIGNALSFSGGFLIGYTFGSVIAGKDLNFAALGAGAGLLCLSIPLNKTYIKLAKKAVVIYNSGLKKSASSTFQLKLGLTLNSIR